MVISVTQAQMLPACRVSFTAIQGLVIGDNCTKAQMLPACRDAFTAFQGLVIGDKQAQMLPACRVTFTAVLGLVIGASVALTIVPRPIHSCTLHSDRCKQAQMLPACRVTFTAVQSKVAGALEIDEFLVALRGLTRSCNTPRHLYNVFLSKYYLTF
jgi:hypothetical protein